MKKIKLLLAALFMMAATALADNYPVNDYEEPRVGDTPPAVEWNALSKGLHATWGSRDVLYTIHRVPKLTETLSAEITAWKGERANIEAVLYSNSDQGNLKVRFVDDKSKVVDWCKARFLNYVITDDYKSCGSHNMSLVKWLVPDVIDQDKAHAVPACETRPVWCSIEVPRDAQTGVQKVTLQVINEKGEVLKNLELTINVIGRTLPAVADQKFPLDLCCESLLWSRTLERRTHQSSTSLS